MNIRETRNALDTTSAFSPPAVFLHWLMVLLIVGVYASMELKTIFPKGSTGRDVMATFHYSLGLSVFVLAWFRLVNRFSGPVPGAVPVPARWESLLGHAVHAALYALMIGLPLLGWLTLSARGESVPFFGVELPPLVGRSRAAAQQYKDIHEAIATAGYFLIGLHALAALFHHYVKRDNTLVMMSPRR